MPDDLTAEEATRQVINEIALRLYAAIGKQHELPDENYEFARPLIISSVMAGTETGNSSIVFKVKPAASAKQIETHNQDIDDETIHEMLEDRKVERALHAVLRLLEEHHDCKNLIRLEGSLNNFKLPKPKERKEGKSFDTPEIKIESADFPKLLAVALAVYHKFDMNQVFTKGSNAAKNLAASRNITNSVDAHKSDEDPVIRPGNQEELVEGPKTLNKGIDSLVGVNLFPSSHALLIVAAKLKINRGLLPPDAELDVLCAEDRGNYRLKGFLSQGMNLTQSSPLETLEEAGKIARDNGLPADQALTAIAEIFKREIIISKKPHTARISISPKTDGTVHS